ncbi:hypothetical protein [Methylobacterium sp. J-090]|uniref:hypothetical protein n=1 Tax=Methylobacterium sp. J-090 TaxID=2836666 RepID=UPI001FBAB99E|nr:hypothetical protein [Methylobacterium sp. J-090]MCJ2084203.1 hypothetical protein [Methylobacterium sp. J-090]
MAYRLTEWTQCKDQDAEICHLVWEEDVDNEEVFATFSNCELGAKVSAAALALANGDVALIDRIPGTAQATA